MAVTTQVKVIIDAQDNASKVLEGLRKEFTNVGKSAENLGKDLETVGKIALAGAAGFLAFATKAAFSAARVEELTFALHAIAKANKLSNTTVDEAVISLREMNIAHEKALQITSLFVQGQLDLKDALKLAKTAQDLAVIAGMDSSEATRTLTEAILSQHPMILRQFGIVKNLNQIYEEYADSLNQGSGALVLNAKKTAANEERLKDLKGQLNLAQMRMGEFTDKTKESTRVAGQMRLDKLIGEIGELEGKTTVYGKAVGRVTKELTDNQKRQAFLNAILTEGAKVAGTYDAAMNSVSKRFRSLTGRIIPDFIAEVGKAFSPALTVIIDNISKSIGDMSKWVKNNEKVITSWGKQMGEATIKGVAILGKLVNFLIDNKEIILGVLVALGVGVAALAVHFVVIHAVVIGVMTGIIAIVSMAAKTWSNYTEGFKETSALVKEKVSGLGQTFEDFKTGLGISLAESEVSVKGFTERSKQDFESFKTGVGISLLEFSESFTLWKEQVKADIAELPEALAYLSGYLIEVAPVAWEQFKLGVGVSLMEMQENNRARTIQMRQDWESFKVGLGMTLLEMEANTNTFIKNAKEAWESFKIGVGISLLELETDMRKKTVQMEEDWESFKTGLGITLVELEDSIYKFIDNVTTNWDEFCKWIGRQIDNVVEKLRGWINTLKEAFRLGQEVGKREGPTYQAGGVVPGPIGEPRTIVAHGGEKVIPAGVAPEIRGAGGGMVFNVYIGLYTGTETEKRNVARDLYSALVQVAHSQNKTVMELMGA